MGAYSQLAVEGKRLADELGQTSIHDRHEWAKVLRVIVRARLPLEEALGEVIEAYKLQPQLLPSKVAPFVVRDLQRAKGIGMCTAQSTATVIRAVPGECAHVMHRCARKPGHSTATEHRCRECESIW